MMSAEDDVSNLKEYPLYFLTSAFFDLLLAMSVAVALIVLIGKLNKTILPVISLATVIIIVVNAVVLVGNYGIIDNFTFSDDVTVTWIESLIDVVILILALFCSVLLISKLARKVSVALGILVSASLLIFFISLYNFSNNINDANRLLDVKNINSTLSRQSNNILVYVMDGAMSGYIPYIFDSDSSLPELYDGFDLYQNVVSTGDRTINGIAPIYGGYDFTVSAVNARSGELVDKVSAAYEVFPENFIENGYRVTYYDPFWYGFVRRGDCSRMLKKYDMRCFNIIDSIGRNKTNKLTESSNAERTYPSIYLQYQMLSLFRVAPATLREVIYDKGEWLGNSASWKKKEDKYLINYMALTSTKDFISVDDDNPTLTVIVNNLTRATVSLDENCSPDLLREIPTEDIAMFKDRASVEVMQTMRCALKGFGELLSWMKANQVYDNTKIIVTSDHGWKSHNPLFDGDQHQLEKSKYQALLMIKEFNRHGQIKENPEFLTNADVAGIVCEEIGGCQSTVSDNVILGKKPPTDVVLHSTPWNPAGQTQYLFNLNATHKVKSNIFQKENWEITHD